MQHGIGEAIPIVEAVPARGRQQPQPTAAIGEPAGDLPADALLVGKHHVQRHRPHIAGGFEGFLDIPCARQIEEGIERSVRLELGGLQRQPVAAAQLQGLQGMLALAQHTVEQRPVAGLVDRLAHGTLSFDDERLVALTRRYPIPIGQIEQAAVLAPDLFQEQILVVPHDHGHAPAKLAVEAGHHGRNPRDGHPGRLEFRRTQLHEIPVRRHRQRQMGIVGHQRLAASRAAPGNRPVVGRRHPEHIQFSHLRSGTIECGQAGNLPAQLQAFELRRLLER